MTNKMQSNYFFQKICKMTLCIATLFQKGYHTGGTHKNLQIWHINACFSAKVRYRIAL